jgi:acetyl esterase/lipase
MQFHRPLRIPTFLALGLALLLAATDSATAAGTRFAVKPVKDVAYFDGPSVDPIRHKLDLYLPKGEKDFPVLFFVHGGGWQRGNKEFLGVYEAIGSLLAKHGIGTVVINYRLSPAVKHPEHIRDVARAFAWTHKHIASYGGRPDRIFLCGHSAGGHLVALLATDPSWLKAEGLNVDAIAGIVAISGIYDLTELPAKYVERAFGPGADVWAAASPTNQARGGLPPFLILYADHDLPGCDRKPAEAFAKALHDKGTKAEVREISGSNHLRILVGAVAAEDPVFQAILNFVTQHAGMP